MELNKGIRIVILAWLAMYTQPAQINHIEYREIGASKVSLRKDETYKKILKTIE